MVKKREKIMIDIDLMKQLENNDFLVYITLLLMNNPNQENQYVSVNYLLFESECSTINLKDNNSFYPYDSNRRIIKIFKDGINNLSKRELITIKCKNKNEWVLTLNDKNPDKFCFIYKDEVKSILSYIELSLFKRIGLLKYFIILIHSFWNSDNYNNITIPKNSLAILPIESEISELSISNKTGLSRCSCIRYNSILEEIGLLYIAKSSNLVVNEDYNYNVMNVYCRPGNKNDANHYLLEYEKKLDHNGLLLKKKKQQRDNILQSMKIKYSYIERGKKYPLSVVKEIEEYFIRYNSQINKEINEIIKTEESSKRTKNKIKKLQDKIKDLSILEDAFLKE